MVGVQKDGPDAEVTDDEASKTEGTAPRAQGSTACQARAGAVEQQNPDRQGVPAKAPAAKKPRVAKPSQTARPA